MAEESYKDSYHYKYGGAHSADYRPGGKGGVDWAEERKEIQKKNTYFNRSYLNVDQYNYLASRINNIKKVRPLTFEDHYAMYPYRSGEMLVPKDLYTIEWEVDLINTNPINTAGGSAGQFLGVYPNGLYWGGSEDEAKQHYFRNNPAQSEEDIIYIAQIDPNAKGSPLNCVAAADGSFPDNTCYHTQKAAFNANNPGGNFNDFGKSWIYGCVDIGTEGNQQGPQYGAVMNGSRCGHFVEWEDDKGGPCLQYDGNGECTKGYGHWKSEKGGCCKRAVDGNGDETDDCATFVDPDGQLGGDYLDLDRVKQAETGPHLFEIVSVLHYTGWALNRGGENLAHDPIDVVGQGEYMIDSTNYGGVSVGNAGADYPVLEQHLSRIERAHHPYWLNILNKLNSSTALEKKYNAGQVNGTKIPLYDQTDYPNPPSAGSWVDLMEESGSSLSDSIKSHTYSIEAEAVKNAGGNYVPLKDPEGMAGQWHALHDRIRRKVGTRLHPDDLEAKYDGTDTSIHEHGDPGDKGWGNLPVDYYMNLTKTTKFDIDSEDYEIVDPLEYDQGIEYETHIVDGKEYKDKDYLLRHGICSKENPHGGLFQACRWKCSQSWDTDGFNQYNDCYDECVGGDQGLDSLAELPCSHYRFIDSTSYYFQKPNHDGDILYTPQDGRRIWHEHFYDVERMKQERGIGDGWGADHHGFSHADTLSSAAHAGSLQCSTMRWFCSDSDQGWWDGVVIPDPQDGSTPNFEYPTNLCRYGEYGKVIGFHVSKRHVNNIGSCYGSKEETKPMKRKDMLLHPSFHLDQDPATDIYGGLGLDYFGNDYRTATAGYGEGVQKSLYNAFVLPPFAGVGGRRGAGGGDKWKFEGDGLQLASEGGDNKGYYTDTAVKKVHWIKSKEVQARAKELGFHFEFRRLGVPYKMVQVDFSHNVASQSTDGSKNRFIRRSGDAHYIHDKWTSNLGYQSAYHGIREYCQDEQFAGERGARAPEFDGDTPKGLYEPQAAFDLLFRQGCGLRSDVAGARDGGKRFMREDDIFRYVFNDDGVTFTAVERKADFADAIIGHHAFDNGWGNWGFSASIVQYNDSPVGVVGGVGLLSSPGLSKVIMNEIPMGGLADVMHIPTPDTSPGGAHGPDEDGTLHGYGEKHPGFYNQLGLKNKSHMSWWGGYDTHSLIFIGSMDDEKARSSNETVAWVGAMPVIGGLKWKPALGQEGANHEDRFNRDFAHHRSWAGYSMSNPAGREHDRAFYQLHNKYVVVGAREQKHDADLDWADHENPRYYGSKLFYSDYEGPSEQWRNGMKASTIGTTDKGVPVMGKAKVLDNEDPPVEHEHEWLIAYSNWHGQEKRFAMDNGLLGNGLEAPYDADGVWPIEVSNLVRDAKIIVEEGGTNAGFRNAFDTVPGDPRFHMPPNIDNDPYGAGVPDDYIGRKNFQEQKDEGCYVPGADHLTVKQGGEWEAGGEGKFSFKSRGYMPHIKKTYQFVGITSEDDAADIQWVRPIGLGTVKHITETFSSYDMFTTDFVKRQALFSCDPHKQPDNAAWGVPNWSRNESCDPIRYENVRLDNGGAQHTGNLIFGGNSHWFHNPGGVEDEWPVNALIEEDSLYFWGYDPTAYLEWGPNNTDGAPTIPASMFDNEIWDNIELLAKNPLNWTVAKRQEEGFGDQKIKDWLTKYGCDEDGGNCQWTRHGIPLPIGIPGRHSFGGQHDTTNHSSRLHDPSSIGNSENGLLGGIITADKAAWLWANGINSSAAKYSTPLASYLKGFVDVPHVNGTSAYLWTEAEGNVDGVATNAWVVGTDPALARFGYDCGVPNYYENEEGMWTLGAGGGGCGQGGARGEYGPLGWLYSNPWTWDTKKKMNADITWWAYYKPRVVDGVWTVSNQTYPHQMRAIFGYGWMVGLAGADTWDAGNLITSFGHFNASYGITAPTEENIPQEQSQKWAGSIDFINISLYDMMYHYDQTAILKVENAGSADNFDSYKAEMIKLRNKRNPNELLYQDYTDYYSEVQRSHVFKWGEEDYQFKPYFSADYSDTDGYAMSSLVLTENMNIEEYASYSDGNPGDVGSTHNMMSTFLRVGHDAINFGGNAANGWKGRVATVETKLPTLNHGLVAGWYWDYTFMDPLQRQTAGSAGYSRDLMPDYWRPVFKTSDMPAADHNFIPKVAKGKNSSAVSPLSTVDGAIGLCPTCGDTEFRVFLASESVTTAVNFYIENMIDLSPDKDSTVVIDGQWNNPVLYPEGGTNAVPPPTTCGCVESASDGWYCECSDGTKYGSGGELNASNGYSQQSECVTFCDTKP